MQFSLSPLSRDGKAFGISVFGRDVTGSARAEEQIARSLDEKETLLRELYHRTKNNMNVIVSMLRLQAAHEGDERLRSSFAEMEDRIMSMSLVHEKLYESNDLSRINLKTYIEELVSRIAKSYGEAEGRVSFVLAMGDVQVLIDTAVSCGLIINEIVSNSMKYAFPEGMKGEIRIELSRGARGEDSRIRLAVSDDGVGLPEDFDVERGGNLGMKIIMSLARGKLRAQVAVKKERGLSYELLFSEEDETPPALAAQAPAGEGSGAGG